MRCRSRASSSCGWKGFRQKSSKRSSRSPSSPSWAPDTRSNRGSSTASRLRNVRHNENAISGSSSATTIAPPQPSAGSSAAAIAAFDTAFQAKPPRSSVCARSAGAGSGNTSKGSPVGLISERLEITRELPRGDLLLVRVPLPPLVADEVVEHVLTDRVPDELRSLHHVEGLGERLRQEVDAGRGTRRGRHLEDVAGGLLGEVVALL